MTFLTPFGLLALLSIVALIIIYLLKPKYQDRVVASSFIWKLSLQYKKKKMPFSWLKNSLLLMLQILTLIMMTIILIQPNYVLATKSGEKIAILDVSASMLANQNGKTRLERAIKEIESLALKTTNEEDKFSVIIAGQKAELIVNRSDSYEYVRSRLARVEGGYAGSNIDEAMSLTESIIKTNASTEIIYFTSNDYKDAGQVTVRNLSNGEFNVAILDFKATFNSETNKNIFTAEIISYGKNLESLTLTLSTDGKYKSSVTLNNLANGQVFTQAFTFDGIDENNYQTAELKITGIEDDFIYDNEMTYINQKETFKIQMVSHGRKEEADSTITYVTHALRSLDRPYRIDFPSTEATTKTEGYDLYIYSERVPSTLPVDGAVWIFNPTTLPSTLGLIGSETTIPSEALTAANEANLYAKIMDSVTVGNITVSKYRQMTPNQNFDILMTYDHDPMLMVSNQTGPKIAIFSFGLSHSNLPILFHDFPTLVKNLSDFSMVPTIDNHHYQTGDTITINKHPIATQVLITSGDYRHEFKTETENLSINKPGLYTINQLLSNGTTKQSIFYASIPRNESDFNFEGELIVVPFIPEDAKKDETKNDLYSLLPYLAAVLLVIIAIEWGVQYREQY